MKRLDYEAPTMELIVVEMEDGFLAASVNQKTDVATTGHELNDVDGSLFDEKNDDGTLKEGNGWI